MGIVVEGWEARPGVPAVGEPRASGARDIRILVVEDDGIVAADIADALTRFGYGLAGRASSGEEATRKALQLEPDLVLMDVRLRGPMDGVAAAQVIMNHRRTPVVFLTASSDASTIERALVTEPLGYLIKPFRDAALRAAVELALSHHRADVASRAREVELAKLSLVDELTRLHNRRGFLALAEQQAAIARRNLEPLGLFFFDLDGLKLVNDTLGHLTGDLAIQDVGMLLQQTFRESDLVARLSGDEFVVLAQGAAPEFAELLIERLHINIREFNERGVRPYRLKVSVGYALRSAESTESISAMIARADARMYAHKRMRREHV